MRAGAGRGDEVRRRYELVRCDYLSPRPLSAFTSTLRILVASSPNGKPGETAIARSPNLQFPGPSSLHRQTASRGRLDRQLSDRQIAKSPNPSTLRVFDSAPQSPFAIRYSAFAIPIGSLNPRPFEPSTPLPHYPFTPPSASPLTNCFCATKNRTMHGIIVTMLAAIR